MKLINICILTYQRGSLLRVCLDSFQELTLPDNTKVVLTVIDNDANKAAEDIVKSYQGVLPIEVNYLCEPTQGIPVARNLALDFSHQINADFIVFIDDDEWVAKDWLVNTYNYYLSQDDDVVVSGEVVSVFPDHCPEHIKQSLQRKPRATGKELTSCATNNVLFSTRITKELGFRFDDSNPLAGGTDTIFFSQVYSSGIKILRCAESIVYEKVHDSRISMRWISRRKYRAGITECWRKRHNGVSSPSIFFSSLYHLIIKLLATVVMFLINNKSRRNRSWFKVCKAAGVMSGLFGVKVDSYKVIDS